MVSPRIAYTASTLLLICGLNLVGQSIRAKERQAQQGKDEADVVTVKGTVRDCFMYALIPSAGKDVFLFRPDDAKPLEIVFQELEDELDAERPPKPICRTSFESDKLYELAEDLRDRALTSLTRRDGTFVIENVPRGPRYFLLAIDLTNPSEDLYFGYTYVPTKEVEVGSKQIRKDVVLGLVSAEECVSVKKETNN